MCRARGEGCGRSQGGDVRVAREGGDVRVARRGWRGEGGEVRVATRGWRRVRGTDDSFHNSPTVSVV